MRMKESLRQAYPKVGTYHRASLPIIDQFDRTFNYLRIAVNEKCNLRCIYCMPEEGIDFRSEDKLLSTEEIYRLIELTSQMGVSKISLFPTLKFSVS